MAERLLTTLNLTLLGRRMATVNIGKSVSLLVPLILPMAAWAQSLETRCRAYGFEPNTPQDQVCCFSQ
jgi:hypothetical protein